MRKYNVRLAHKKACRGEFFRVLTRILSGKDLLSHEQDEFLARRLRISTRQVQRYRSAEANMSLKTYRRLLRALPIRLRPFLDPRCLTTAQIARTAE